MNTGSSASSSVLYQPAEWQPHRACWLAWPSHENLWGEVLPLVQAEFSALCEAITAGSNSRTPVENLEVLVLDEGSFQSAKAALGHLPVRFHRIPFGDIWLRDTAPIFLINETDLVAGCFEFNGWGGKYDLPGDREIAANIAKVKGGTSKEFSWILEGGSVEVDGEGTCLTSKQCLLNPNRNPNLDLAAVESSLKTALGVSKVLWLENGLLNDHTDGHIDTIARFAAPGVALSMLPDSEADPNFDVLHKIHYELCSFLDARGRKLEVRTIPSPGKVTDEDGRILPASYLNFYIANHTVVVPIYGSANDQAAVAAIAKCFPTRKTVGLFAKSILAGGGAFHCITQQEPLQPNGGLK